jgi:hypothetical protein
MSPTFRGLGNGPASVGSNPCLSATQSRLSQTSARNAQKCPQFDGFSHRFGTRDWGKFEFLPRRFAILSQGHFRSSEWCSRHTGVLRSGRSTARSSYRKSGLMRHRSIRAKAARPDTVLFRKLVAIGNIELRIVATTQIVTTPGVELWRDACRQIAIPSGLTSRLTTRARVYLKHA